MLYDMLITSHIDSEKVVLTDSIEEYSYQKIDSICNKIGIVLKNKGVLCGDKVLIVMEKNISSILVMLSCIRSGICLIPVSPQISEYTMNAIFNDCIPKLVIENKKTELSNDTEHISASDLVSIAMNIVEKTEPVISYEIVYILYTSGSTGTPKGVVASEENVVFCIEAINKRLRNSSDDRILCCLPLSFDYGLYQIFLALASEACAVVTPEIPIQQIVPYLIKEEITGFPAMPAMLQMLIRTRLLEKANFSKLRYITSTGDNFPVTLISRLMELFPSTEIIPMYGLTECKRVSIMPTGRTDKILQGSCGLPLDNVEVWIDSETDELIVCGNNVMMGYWNDPELTSNVYFTDDRGKRCLRTGDRFRIDDDGFLYFIGRNKNFLKVNGFRISTVEIEEYIYSMMHELIDEICVFGIADEVIGEKIAVCVRSDKDESLVFENFSIICKGLSAYQRPHYLYCTSDSLPRNQNGKIDRKQIKENGVHNGYKKCW